MNAEDVLRALGRGALLFEDAGCGTRMGCFLYEGTQNTPVHTPVFRSLEEAGLIAPVFSPRLPQRWRATEAGKAFLARLDKEPLREPWPSPID